MLCDACSDISPCIPDDEIKIHCQECNRNFRNTVLGESQASKNIEDNVRGQKTS
jgi:hypothetical protein